MIKFRLFNNWNTRQKCELINIFGFNIWKYGFEIALFNFWFMIDMDK